MFTGHRLRRGAIGNARRFCNAVLFSATSLVLSGSAGGQVITEFPTTYQSPWGIAAGPDGNVWFAEIGNSADPPYNPSAAAIGRVAPDGTITDFPIPLESLAFSVSAGPDGNLWITETNANRIGRLSTTGTLTEFPVPTAQSGLQGIAAGPDGNLWFAEQSANKIGRITPGGIITEFPLLTAGSTPESVTAGPDGALWFTETNANNVGRITTAGQVTEFPIPTAAALPHRIVSGPDGNLWFTEGQGQLIAKITPAGVITEFPLPLTMTYPMGIAAGPDGNLWFTGGFNGIGRITTSGVITGYVLPAPFTQAYAVAPGPDGNVWFTEPGNGRIGRVAPAPCGAPTTLCLHSGRFLAQVTWEGEAPVPPPAQAVRMTDDSGYFWFYGAGNVEVVVKVVDGCAANGHFWVFGAGMTNVLVNLSVQDAVTGNARTYTNPSGTPFEPVQDTSTFRCP
jgi:streptogramin lyase